MSFRSQRSYVNRTVSYQCHYNVFFINAGYTVDIDTQEKITFGDIQRRIDEKLDIPPSEQILILKNGTRLPDSQVCDPTVVGCAENLFFLYQSRTVEQKSRMNEHEGILKLYENLQKHIPRLPNMAESRLQSDSFTKTCYDVCKKIFNEHIYLNQAVNAMARYLHDIVIRMLKSLARFDKCLRKLEVAKSEGSIVFDDFAKVFDILKMIPMPEQLAVNIPTPEGEEVSLYHWIRSKDPVYHLDDLVEHVKHNLEEINQQPLTEIHLYLDKVKLLLNDKNHNQISGFDKRTDALTQRLTKMHTRCGSIRTTLPQINTVPELLNFLETAVQEILQDTAVFQKSKDEVVQFSRKLIQKFFNTNFDNIKNFEKKIFIFDERMRNVKAQLHLLNQIRETPILYFTAVSEVIRRNTLNEQFQSWFQVAKDKCVSFLEEENKSRAEIDRKLSKHYLRSLFPGMSDQIAPFQPLDVVFDTNLPKISNEYLHLLREKFKDMDSLLNVTAPDVFNRLAIVDKTAPLSVATSQATLRREESFFVRDKTVNIALMNRNFPSMNYLSGIDVECSPGSLTRFDSYSPGPHHYGESFAGAVALKPLFDIGSRDDGNQRTPRSRCFSSDPIAIPNSMTTSKGLSVSSSQFGTPEDNYGSAEKLALQQKKESTDSEKNDTIKDTFKSMKEALVSCNVEFESVYTDIKENQAIITELLQLKEPFDKLQNALKDAESRLDVQKDDASKIAIEKDELSKIVEHEKYIRKEKEEELEDSRNRMKELTDKFNEQEKQIAEQNKKLNEQNEEMEKLREKVLNITVAKDNLQADFVQLESVKQQLEHQVQTDVDHDFLGIELKTLGDLLDRQLSDEEIERIKLEIEKRRVISPTPSEQAECTKPVNQSKEYEQALVVRNLSKKLSFIIRGVEDRKNAEIGKLQNELGVENKRVQLLKEKLNDLETEITRMEVSGIAKRRISTESTSTGHSMSLDALSNSNMLDSCMVVNSVVGSSHIGDLPITEEEHDGEDEVIDDEVIPINTASTQTRICMKEMNMMISLHDIHVGCSVLVMWDNTHTSYMVFSTSRTLHFVRETSMRRLGIDTSSPARRSWMFAMVVHIDYCQIRKENNRYNMPLGTRFYRVDVRPLAIEQSSSLPNMRG